MMKVTIVLSNVAVFASGQDQQQCADNAGLEDCVPEHDERDESLIAVMDKRRRSKAEATRRVGSQCSYDEDC